MTYIMEFGPKGFKHGGNLHPEAAEPALEILKRDLQIMEERDCISFLRPVYSDLDEIGLLRAQTDVPIPKPTVAMLVVSLIKGDTNVRIPLGPEQLKRNINDKKNLDLYSVTKAKGFGRVNQ